VDRIRAAVISTANAVHMTAPAEDRHNAKKPLQQGSHPHMTNRAGTIVHCSGPLNSDGYPGIKAEYHEQDKQGRQRGHILEG
jgi:hypothetical protein